MRAALVLAGLTVLLLVGCSSSRNTASQPTVQVVAAENFWGSIAAQLGGNSVHVTSIVHDPATDPHDYEPSAIDARTLAGANLVIENGIGYDPWVPKLLAANPVSGREVLDVGTLVGIPDGGNPHRWYSPPNVHAVIDAITRDYQRLDHKNAATFARLKTQFLNVGLRAYTQEITTIRKHYAGVKVGASESIFAPLAQALGLDLVTPPSFLKAISEGGEPTAQDLTTIGRQISTREIKVWVFNSQNSTPDVQRLTSAAKQQHIPVTTITETLAPANASFESWQLGQLQQLSRALAQATGK